ncbi:hypothetical protein NG796_14110 [Laspinema sp. A4]|uniref:hypothetical protein n=1 Tax=Laspinema sp. D2d TaxID=2953686 RepID=UPI0021BAC063|nr:hypothetical protein [Laspinema sp. D2d]MCT7984431.1 hypothetical protein [Laspinema sp. D2d]
MLEFCTSFILIIVLVYPAQKFIILVARLLNKHLPENTPLLPNLPMKTATSQLKLKQGHANPKETQLAVRGAIVVSGFIAAAITGFTWWIPILIWVVIIRSVE